MLGRIILTTATALLMMLFWFAYDFGFAVLASRTALSLIQRTLLQWLKAAALSVGAAGSMAFLLGNGQAFGLLIPYFEVFSAVFGIAFGLGEWIRVIRVRRLCRLASEAWDSGDRLRSLSYREHANSLLAQFPGRVREIEADQPSADRH